MLSYAFQTLNGQGYRDMATEDFHNVAGLCAAILCKGVSLQIKRGLGREYIEKTESLSALRGKIDISESLKTRSMLRQRLVCSYDDFSVNSPLNQIIKSTMLLLLHGDISLKQKKEIRQLLVFFDRVDAPDIHSIDWHVQYNRNNETYRMLISVCYLVVKGLLQTQSDGSTKLMDFLDEQHFPQFHASASQIPWILDDDENNMLPVMQSDITLSQGNDVLIIDAKYYSHTTQSQYDVHTLHSNNLYQIFTYVKNKEAELANVPHEKVAGMLLYARTDEAIQPDHTYHMSGNSISVKTLNLDCSFDEIAAQLNKIAQDHFHLS
jgi:5-methylcytosine-specific restriction enzyme subunit McrC